MNTRICFIVFSLLLYACGGFGQKPEIQMISNPYAGHDSTNQLRPSISKGDFFRMTGFDFGWLVLEPINLASSLEHEVELSKRFSEGQKAIYFWWFMDAQVTNGGFIQFYVNGYGSYVPAIIRGLEHIGDQEVADLAKKAHQIYLANQKLFKKDYDERLYDRLDELSSLDSDYYDLNEQTMAGIERYAKQNPQEFCVDENGKTFSANFSGKGTTTFENSQKREEYEVKDGLIHGIFRTYHETGGLASVLNFEMGKQTGEQKFWDEQERLKKVTFIDPLTLDKKKTYYHENGQRSKLIHTDSVDQRNGEFKTWYPNGQLKEKAAYISNYQGTGEQLKFWENGDKKLEASYKDGKFMIHNYWNEAGEQLLQNGSGIYMNDWESFGKITQYETEYKNYQRHGMSKTFEEGRLVLEQEFKSGKEDGITRRFYENGAVKEEILYRNGDKISEKQFDKFKNPKVFTFVSHEMEDEMLTNRELPTADSYPIPLNAGEADQDFNIDASFFDGYSQDDTLSYMYFVSVNKTGKVSKYDFLYAQNWDMGRQVEAHVKKLKFSPARKDRKAVASYVIIWYHFVLVENDT